MISNFLQRIVLSDSTHTKSITNLVAIGVEILKTDSGCSLEKEF